MTIYDLTEAIKRNGRWLAIGFGVLVFIVILATFTIEEGSPSWRAQEKYQSTIQIAVIDPDTTSFTETQARRDQLRTQAALYSSLLRTDEAWLAVSDAIGEELGDGIEAELSDQSALLTVTVTASSPEKSIEAAEEVFTYLTRKLQQPLNTAGLVDETPTTTIAFIRLEGTFDSFATITFDEDLGSTRDDLFLQIDIENNNPTTLAIASNAGQSVSSSASLNPTVSLVLRLVGTDDETQDTVRLAPPPLPELVPAIPALQLVMGGGSVIAPLSDEPARLNIEAIDLQWVDVPTIVDPNVEPPEETAVEIVLVTEEIGVIPIGGRRGPITAVTVLIVGSLLLLAGVIVVESWRRAKPASDDDADHAVDEVESSVGDTPKSPNGSASAEDEAPPVDHDPFPDEYDLVGKP